MNGSSTITDTNLLPGQPPALLEVSGIIRKPSIRRAGTWGKPNRNGPCASFALMTTRMSGTSFKIVFTHLGHRVMVAAGGKGGGNVPTATRKNQPYEVVITDMGMPDIDGRQVARTIKAESPTRRSLC